MSSASKTPIKPAAASAAKPAKPAPKTVSTGATKPPSTPAPASATPATPQQASGTSAPSQAQLGVPAPSPAPVTKGEGRAKVARHVDAKVAARNSALNAIGGVKVDVFVRVRPRLPMEASDNDIVVCDDETNTITLKEDDRNQAFTFDRVYDQNASQEQLFQDCVVPIVDQVSRGMACAVLTYGQTGAGKTYTMRGDLSPDDPSKFGIIQRSIEYLFRQFQEKMYSNVSMKCTFLEIYNEELEDLFVEKPNANPLAPRRTVRQRLGLVDDAERGTAVTGLSEVEIKDVATIMQLLTEADARCRFAETKMNKLSNRAHRIFTIMLSFRRADTDVKTSFTLVDLAGSEDISRSGWFIELSL